MLNNSQQQDEAARRSVAASHIMGPPSPNLLHHHHNPHQAHLPSDIAIQLQQAQVQKQQMDLLNKLINATTSVHQVRASPSLHHEIGLQQQTRELLNRPEAQAILQGELHKFTDDSIISIPQIGIAPNLKFHAWVFI